MLQYEMEFAYLGRQEAAAQIGDSLGLDCSSLWSMDFNGWDVQEVLLPHVHTGADWSLDGILFPPWQQQQQQEKLKEEEEQQQFEQQICEFKEKKMNHNAYERQRRKKVNVLYRKLDRLMPPPHVPVSEKKANNQAILQRALAYIPRLRTKISELKEQKRQLLNQEKPAVADSSNGIASVEIKAITVSTEGMQTLLTIHLSGKNKQCMFPLLAFLDNTKNLQVLGASMFVFSDSAWSTFHILNDESIDEQVNFREKIKGFLETHKTAWKHDEEEE